MSGPGRALVALAVAGVLAAAPAAVRAGERIKIAVPASAVTLAPLYTAQTAGYFAAEGLDVEIVPLAGAASVQAVIAREATFAVAPGTYQLAAYEKGQRLLAVMSLLARNTINVVVHTAVAKDRGLTAASPLADKIAALKGLKLSAGAVGSFSHQVLRDYLLRAGLDPQKDVKLVGVGSAPAMLVALEQRKVDGFAIGTPIPETAVARGFGVMIVDNAGGEDPDFAAFMMEVLIVAPDYAEHNPEIVRKTVRALLRASRWLLDHPAEQAMATVKPFLGPLDDAVLVAGLRKVRLGIPRDGRITERAVTLTQDFLRRIGALKTTVPFTGLVTSDYLPR